MKKVLFAITTTITFCAATSAQEVNLLKNGSFEQISKVAKASDKYIMARIKKGWDFGAGPVAKVPTHWIANAISGKVKLRIITVGDNGENKEHVAEGKNSLYMNGPSFHLYNSVGLKPGKYKFSFKYKGSGRITLCFYCYKKDPKTGRGIHVISRAPMTVMAKPQWQTYTKEMEIGKWQADIDTCTFALTGSNADFYIDDMIVCEVK